MDPTAINTPTGEHSSSYVTPQEELYPLLDSKQKKKGRNPAAMPSNLLEDDAYLALASILRVSASQQSISRVDDISQVLTKPKHGACLIAAKAVVSPFVCMMPFMWCAVGKIAPVLIPQGHLGLSTNNGVPEFLAPGWHWLLSPLRKLDGQVALTQPVIQHKTRAIVTVPPGYIGYLEDGGQPLVLGPGIHQWDSNTIVWHGLRSISERMVEIGPYTLLTVPEGECAVTNNNGVLEILGAEKLMGLLGPNERPKSRTYLLNHAKWKFSAWLATTEQFDPLKASALLTNDRVELDLESTVAWRIIDPIRAAKQGGGMDKIRNLVHREARATVADMVLTTKISSGIKGPDSKAKQQSAQAVITESGSNAGDVTFAHGGVSTNGVDSCSKRLERVGVQVDTINIVQLDIRDPQIRDRLSQAAVLSTKVQESSEVALTEAKNLEIKARAEAEAIRLKAQADADSITLIAEAEAQALRTHAEAATESGNIIGKSEPALQMEHLRLTGDALNKARATMVFAPGGMDSVNQLLPSQAIASSMAMKQSPTL